MRLLFTDEAKANLKSLESDPSKKPVLKAVRKALGYMETNLRHPGLKTHKYSSIRGPRGEEVFEAYAQNQAAQAYRIFWHYGPGKGDLSVVAITPRAVTRERLARDIRSSVQKCGEEDLKENQFLAVAAVHRTQPA